MQKANALREWGKKRPSLKGPGALNCVGKTVKYKEEKKEKQGQ